MQYKVEKKSSINHIDNVSTLHIKRKQTADSRRAYAKPEETNGFFLSKNKMQLGNKT